MRRLLVAVALISSSCFALAGAQAASASSLPPEGIFENCALDTQMPNCVQRLEVMQQGGLRVVVVPDSGASLACMTTYAAIAHSLGMSVMWETSDQGWWRDPSTGTEMSSAYSAFATGCACTENGQVLSYMIRWLSQLPGTYGYYAADDSMLSPGDQAGVSAYMSTIKQIDPAHTAMIGAADGSQASQYQPMTDVVGTEIYPVTDSSLMPAASHQDMWSSVTQGAIDAQSTADRAGKQSAFILQAFTWGDNLADGQAIGTCTPSDTQLSCYQKLTYPSAAAQLQLRNEILLHAHPKLILWWSFQGTYGQAENDTYSIYPTGSQAAARWAGLSAAIQAPAQAGAFHAKAVHVGIARKHLRVTGNDVTVARSGGSITHAPQPAGSQSQYNAARTGATVSYTDTQAARTTFTILQSLPGIRSARGCTAAAGRRPKAGSAKRCTHFADIGSFTHRDHAGTNSFHFTGRLNGARLIVGKYRLRAFGT